ncbi:hypothetical protein NM688_g6947 [Phlebia brevispora]|uniref:Uncharacterized protein n=1 Tax=Phlebia brevispora TaxID=194682 RepID=A0ACC1SAM0_9APHY|nr:hypothetical protein NM688_g6947 [Phlebia brevispora]
MDEKKESITIKEWDDSGHQCATYAVESSTGHVSTRYQSSSLYGFDVVRFLKNAFLPAGYPLSVSPDYLRYQIYNVLQAFCSSLASLIASRAVLEGHGVGNASASATDALLLTILQDVFSRVTTILSAYYLGTLLFPEAKTYRLLADILNDAALVLDTLSPHLASFFCLHGWCLLISRHRIPADSTAVGDIGDLSAKDGSKETVLALLGMLCGSLVVPHLHDAYTTYGALAILIIAHLIINYIGVRTVVLRSLNRQRASILFSSYRGTQIAKGTTSIQALSPNQVAAREYIFASPSALLQPDATDGRNVSGFCTMGVPLSTLINPQLPRGVLNVFSGRGAVHTPSLNAALFEELLSIHSEDKYILWLAADSRAGCPHVVIVLKEGHVSLDHVRAWLHASELAHRLGGKMHTLSAQDVLKLIGETRDVIKECFDPFMASIKQAGWSLDGAGGGLLVSQTRTIRVEQGDRKTR